MPRPRVYADFHNLDDANRLRLTCRGTTEDLRRLGIQLQDGLALTFYMDDADNEGQPDEILVDGEVSYHAAEQCWVARVDWSTVRHASDGGTAANNAVSAGPSTGAHSEQSTAKS